MRNCKRLYKLIGIKLRDARIDFLLEPKDMAYLFGIDKDTYMEYESGLPIPIALLMKISELYEMSVTSLLPTIAECNVMWCFNRNEALQKNKRIVRKDGWKVDIIEQNISIGHKP